MNYDNVADNIAAKIALWSLPLLDEKRPVEGLGPLAIETCYNLHTIANMALLSQGDHHQFLANLSRSARVWALFLRRAKGASPRPHHYVSGRIDPILDGIAAGDWTAIGWIHKLAPAEKQGRSEYEDDYCYVRLLLGLSLEPDKKESLEQLINRYREYDDGARVAVCEALIKEDTENFNQIILDIIDNFKKQCKEVLKINVETPVLTARSSICVEALALLRLAEQRSMHTEMDYHLCPSLARKTYEGNFPEEFTI